MTHSADGSPGTAASADTEDPVERAARLKYIEDLIARGEAVPEGEDIPPGATHVIVAGENGPVLKRIRFSGP
jgi:hypothetical protein